MTRLAARMTRLTARTDRLDAAAIVLPGVEVRVVRQCASTNSALIEEKTLKPPFLLAAEEQTDGRGGGGGRWPGARGRDIPFSLARRIARPTRELAALSLVAGVATAKALRACGVSQAALMWPNDLVVGDAKLGGILVETRSQTNGSRASASLAVIGIGINCRRAPALERRLRRRVAFLEEFLSPVPSRNQIIQKTGSALQEALDVFEARGFEALREEWLALHARGGQPPRVRLPGGLVVTGIPAGLGHDGGVGRRLGVGSVASAADVIGTSSPGRSGGPRWSRRAGCTTAPAWSSMPGPPPRWTCWPKTALFSAAPSCRASS